MRHLVARACCRQTRLYTLGYWVTPKRLGFYFCQHKVQLLNRYLDFYKWIPTLIYALTLRSQTQF